MVLSEIGTALTHFTCMYNSCGWALSSQRHKTNGPLSRGQDGGMVGVGASLCTRDLVSVWFSTFFKLFHLRVGFSSVK